MPHWVAEPSLGGTLRQRDLEWDARTRHFAAYVPSRLARSPDLVFVVHGSGSSGSQMRALTAFAFDVIADANGAVIVYPDGYDGHWNDCRRAGPYAANRENVDDVGFLRAVAAALERELGVGFAAVFATGFSNGGHMALRLALEAPEWITAAAPIAANLPTADNLDCQMSGRPTAFMLMNGTADPMNPYGGGEVALYGLLAPRGPVQSSDASVAYFARLAGHSGDAALEPIADLDPDDGTHVEQRVWRAPGRPPVALVTIIGGGHAVPHPGSRLPRVLGRTSQDINGPAMIWSFFGEAKAARNGA